VWCGEEGLVSRYVWCVFHANNLLGVDEVGIQRLVGVVRAEATSGNEAGVAVQFLEEHAAHPKTQ